MIAWIQQLDVATLHALFSARAAAFTDLMIGVSAWGEWTTLLPLAAIITIGLYIKARRGEATGLLVAVFGSGAAVTALKALVARPRPPIAFWAVSEQWYSFPSAHAALSLSFYGFLVYLVCRSNARPLYKHLALAIGILIPLLISFSRIYLGVHYLSDVVVGLIVGALFLWLGVREAQRRATIER